MRALPRTARENALGEGKMAIYRCKAHLIEFEDTKSKIVSEGVPGRSLRVSGALLEAPGAPSGHFLRKEREFMKI